MKDYVGYIDTDSVFIKCGEFLKDQGIYDAFEKLSIRDKTDFIDRMSHIIKDYINDRSFEETQKTHYNSIVDDFRITFNPEKIALSGLFAAKKRYATWTYLNEGKWKDDITITGLEVNRSDSPEIVKPMIINILKMILKKEKDDVIRSTIKDYKSALLNATPDEIAENKGINGLDKYIEDRYNWKKGTPHHLKGVANFDFLIHNFNLQDKYEIPRNGNKAKILYIKKNKFNRDCLSFYKFPVEFDKLGIVVDYEKMIYNNFTKKIENYLKCIDKVDLLNSYISLF